MNGTERIREAFAKRKAAGQSALVIYLTFGDPTPDSGASLMRAAAEAGADVVELGVPFSDPNADGVVIQAAMERALGQGATLRGALEAVSQARASGCEIPVVLFGYYNPLVAMGVDEFCANAAEAGVDAVLTVDLPMDELAELHQPLSGRGLGVIPLVAPTSGEARIAAVREFEPPFVYYVSMTGVTGSQLAKVVSGPERVAAVQAATGAPVAVGFGIKTPEDAHRVGSYADGVVVGSAVVQYIADGPADEAPDRVRAFVGSLREGLDG